LVPPVLLLPLSLPNADSIPLTLVFKSAIESDKYEPKYEPRLLFEVVNETAKNEKKKNTTITPQAAVTTINAILLIATPPTAAVTAELFFAAAGFAVAGFAVAGFAAADFAAAGFAVAGFTGVPHEAQNFSPSARGFPHFEQLAMFSLLPVLKKHLK
jgi:hypothetical protein